MSRIDDKLIPRDLWRSVKLSREQQDEVFKCAVYGWTHKRIAKAFGVSESCIGHILRRDNVEHRTERKAPWSLWHKRSEVYKRKLNSVGLLVEKNNA